MELYNLEWSPHCRFSVTDIDDYNIKGTFDPNAASDIEFYGYRETTFTVSSVEILLMDDLWVEDETSLKEQFIKYYEDKLTLIVQEAIDDKQGEF